MNTDRLPLRCSWHWKTSTFQGSQDSTFNDASPMVIIKINRGLKHSQLIDQIFDLIESNCDKNKLKITCHYIANDRKYVTFPVLDDKSVDIMVDKTEEKGLHRIELHIEKPHEPVGSHPNACFIETDHNGNYDPGDPSYALFLVQLPDGKLQLCRMKQETSVKQLASTFVSRGYNDFRFIYQSRQLGEHQTLKEYDISDYSVVRALGRLRGD